MPLRVFWWILTLIENSGTITKAAEYIFFPFSFYSIYKIVVHENNGEMYRLLVSAHDRSVDHTDTVSHYTREIQFLLLQRFSIEGHIRSSIYQKPFREITFSTNAIQIPKGSNNGSKKLRVQH